MEEPIISVSGLRGIIGVSLSPALAMRYAAAFAGTLPQGPMVISRDSRPSGKMLSDAICSCLMALGRDVFDAGIAATPTTGVLIKSLQAVGGIQISASHNPSQYNGMKLFNAAGGVISAVEGEKVIADYRAEQFDWATHENIGQSLSTDNKTELANQSHWALIEKTIDVEAIRSKEFKVLLDSNAGAGSVLGCYVLEQLGCEVTMLGGEPDGQFIHTPEPTAENLKSVLQNVQTSGSAIGFCQDPDADRLALIDENGRYIGEEYTVALCVDHVLQQTPGPIVTNCSTSRMSQDLAEKYNVPFYHSAVGEANVTGLMREKNAVFGGEGNGGPIDPRVGYVRDSFVGMALVLDSMAKSGKPLSQLADELPRYEIEKTKISLPKDKYPAAIEALKKRFADAESNTMDGLRLNWPESWLLVRASNTEPVVRAIAEAKTREQAEQLCADATEVLAEV